VSYGEQERRLQEALARYREARGRAKAPQERPSSIYEMITRERLEELARDVAEIKEEVTGLRKMMLGAFVSLALTFLGLMLDVALRGLGVI